jgi:pimeloyl-ACP methyl ester carboxylesterase
MTPKARRRVSTAAAVAGGIGLAAWGAVALERRLIRQARAAPDPWPVEPLAERPGTALRLRSFDGTELAVNVVGPEEAPTLVFVHGFTLDMTAWHFQWRALSSRYRCVLYDQRAHGQSGPAAARDHSLEAMAQDLRTVLDETGVDERAVLVGHSLGGMAVVAFAAAFPEEFGDRVRGVVLANTAVADLLRSALGNLGSKAALWLLPAARRLVADPRRAYRIRERLVGGGADLAFLIARATNFGPDAPPSMIDHVVSISARAPVEVWTDVMTSLIEMDITDALEHVRVPALVIASDLDRLTPPASARAMTERLPDGRLVEIEGAGHCAMLEKHERFNALLDGFAREVVGPPAERAEAAARPR